jgi:carbon monoxide dehydrogenase subunit G
MRVRLERVVEVGAPAARVWDLVTDWSRQSEWVPLTRVETVGSGHGQGARIRAWTGVGPVGFWDPMTITAWERTEDGGGRCEVLHLGRLVKGGGEFAVAPLDGGSCRFVWAELVDVPLGALGALGWRLARPVAERVLDRALQRMRRIAEREQAARPTP